MYSFGTAVSEHLGLVLGLGLGGAVVMSVAIMLMFPICAPPLLLILLLASRALRMLHHMIYDITIL